MTQFNKLYTHPLFSIIHTAAMCTYPVQPICTFSCTSVFFINIFLIIFIIHSILYCAFYLIAHLTHFILLFVPFFILTYIYIYIYIYIYSLVLCFICFIAYFYFIFYFIIIIILFFFALPLSGPVLTYISLLIIPCMIVYVTNNKEPWTLNHE